MASHPDQILSCNGISDFLPLGSAKELGLCGQDFTAEVWIQLPLDLGDDLELPILGCEGTLADPALHLFARGPRLYLTGAGTETRSTTPLAAGALLHVAVRYCAARGGERALFVNGTLDAVSTAPAPLVAAGTVFLGRSRSGRSFAGLFTELRIWSEARTERQILATLLTRLTGQERSLSGYWPLSGGSIGPGLRSTSGESERTQPNSARWATGLTPLRDPETSKTPGTALFLDGAGSHLAVDEAVLPSLNEALTVEAWVRPADLGAPAEAGPVLSKYGKQSGWELRASGDQCGFAFTADQVTREVSFRGPLADTWCHVAGSFDGQRLRLYVNGVLKDSVPCVGVPTVCPTELNIGRSSYWPERCYAGQLAEVRVWQRALSPPEIQRALFERIEGAQPGLIAVWHLGGQLADSSLRGHRTSAQGAVRWTLGDPPLPRLPAERREGTGLVPWESEPADRAVGESDPKLQQLIEKLAATERKLRSAAHSNSELTRQLLSMKEQVAEQTARAARSEEEMARLSEQLARSAAIDATGSLPLQGFVQQVGSELARARAELRKQGGSFSLRRVGLELKALIAPSGLHVRFLQPDEIDPAAMGQLSVLKLEFDPEDAPEAQPATLAMVPAVVGYTEVMARRKLAEAGFLIEVSYQAVQDVPGQTVQSDRVVNQHPRPGAQAAAGATVVVFIGKAS